VNVEGKCKPFDANADGLVNLMSSAVVQLTCFQFRPRRGRRVYRA
jgi:acyl transferase domain-containing protein